jgi:predicted nucleic acid-binding protein
MSGVVDTPIFIDANVPMYASGAPHELKGPCARTLGLVETYPAAFATDAEVLQELLHRFRTSTATVGSTDAAFDVVAGLRRLDPRPIASWRVEVS